MGYETEAVIKPPGRPKKDKKWNPPHFLLLCRGNSGATDQMQALPEITGRGKKNA